MTLAAMNGLQMLGLIFGIGVAIVLFLIGLSISAFILKLACRTAGAEVPDTGRAMVVSFLESLAGAVAWICSVMTISFVGVAVQAEKMTMATMAGFSVATVAFVVPAGVYVPMLRVTFQKGLAIAILRYVITLALLAVIGFAIVSLTGKHR